ncbi:gluconate 2-dehydrogenase subunit 3 family protein [Pendulispora brunnea]|uniref:Gluconate 2-dehydrogenase subunit 3 family protein n=1 Tax=Pendulispora brunnea TaxID=2905690 RepID=A0ABZ2KPY9_9BACT
MAHEAHEGDQARQTVSRRRFLRLGIVGGLLVSTGSLVAYVRTRGYVLDAERARRLKALSPWHVIVVEHAARRIAAADAPEDASIPSADDTDVAGFVDGYVAKLPSDMRTDLLRFLAVLEHVAPLAQGYGTRFSRLPAADQDRVLTSLEQSSTLLLRAGFEGLKSLVFMGYYRDPRTWKILGYPGPWVNRP